MKRNVTVAVGALCLAAAGWTMAYGQDSPTQRPVTPPPSPTRPQMEQPSTGGGTQAMNEVCPVGIEGLQAQVMTIPEGGALQLTVAQSQVPELRSRMQRFQQIHQQNAQMRQRSGSMGSGSTGGGASAGATPPPRSGTGTGATGGGSAGSTGGSGSMGGSQQAMQHFADESALIHQAQAVRVVEIPNGVRLEVTQLPSAQLQALRTELRQTAQQLTQGRCPLALQIEA